MICIYVFINIEYFPLSVRIPQVDVVLQTPKICLMKLLTTLPIWSSWIHILSLNFEYVLLIVRFACVISQLYNSIGSTTFPNSFISDDSLILVPIYISSATILRRGKYRCVLTARKPMNFVINSAAMPTQVLKLWIILSEMQMYTR